MKVTIQVKGKQYDIFGVEGIDQMAQHKDGLFFYFIAQMDGRWTRHIRYAKVISVRVCDLENTFTTYETKQALGWL